MIAADTIASVHETSARSDAAYALSMDIPFVVSEAGESVCKWRPAPGELVNLWDMLRITALDFSILMKALTRVEEFANQWHEENPGRQITLEGKARDLFKFFFEATQRISENLELNLSLQKLKRLAEEMDKGVATTTTFRNSLQDIGERIDDELKNHVFMFIPTAKAKLYEEDHPFGTEVSNKLPQLVEDVTEASKCLGLNRSTAVVFHLMRTLEIVVQNFANRLNAAINLEQPWGDILKSIDDEIEKLPGGRNATTAEKEWKTACSEVAVFLRHVKDAWRNTTMHPKRTYTEEEAKRIFEAVKTFVQTFAKL